MSKQTDEAQRLLAEAEAAERVWARKPSEAPPRKIRTMQELFGLPPGAPLPELSPTEQAEYDKTWGPLIAAAAARRAQQLTEPEADSAPPVSKIGFEFRDWRGKSIDEIVAAGRAEEQPKRVISRALLLSGRFDTRAIVEALKCSDGSVSNARTSLIRDVQAGRLAIDLPASVTDSRSLSHRGQRRPDLKGRPRKPR